MAKQTGIHQIKGKIGEHSYYRQKGVASGLIRQINQGLSARVKTDEAFANTRLNNEEFKHANLLASVAFKTVPNRKRNMMLNFAVARMTKRALEAIKAGSGLWGDRRPSVAVDALSCEMLEKFAKAGEYHGEYGDVAITALTAQGAGRVEFTLSEELIQSLIDDGVNTITYVGQVAAIGVTASGTEQYILGGTKIASVENTGSLTPGSEDVMALAFNVGNPTNVGMLPASYTQLLSLSNYGFYFVVSILPARTVDGAVHTLQEKCTYVAIPFGKIPTT